MQGRSTPIDIFLPHPAPPEPDRAAVTASACGKAILVGEHAVVYGAQAIALPLPHLRLTLTLGPCREPEGAGDPPHPSEDNPVAGMIEEALPLLGIEPFPMRLEGESQLLIGAGLGASAALSVVIVRALLAAAGRKASAEEVAAWANTLERRFHGQPSGLDTAVVAFERPVFFRRGQPPQPLTIQPPAVGSWRFALIDSGTRAATSYMIARAAPYFADRPEIIAACDHLTLRVKDGLAVGELEPVAAALREAQAHLRAANLEGEVLRGVIDQAERCGAVAVKLTGSGGGGCALALLDPARGEGPERELIARFGRARVSLFSIP